MSHQSLTQVQPKNRSYHKTTGTPGDFTSRKAVISNQELIYGHCIYTSFYISVTSHLTGHSLSLLLTAAGEVSAGVQEAHSTSLGGTGIQPP